MAILLHLQPPLLVSREEPLNFNERIELDIDDHSYIILSIYVS